MSVGAVSRSAGSGGDGASGTLLGDTGSAVFAVVSGSARGTGAATTSNGACAVSEGLAGAVVGPAPAGRGSCLFAILAELRAGACVVP